MTRPPDPTDPLAYQPPSLHRLLALWANLSDAERDEVEAQIARSGEPRDAWLLAYLRGERLLQRDVDDLDDLWVAGQHAWELIQRAQQQEHK